jgi:NAD(P)H-flavin reductase
MRSIGGGFPVQKQQVTKDAAVADVGQKAAEPVAEKPATFEQGGTQQPLPTRLDGPAGHPALQALRPKAPAAFDATIASVVEEDAGIKTFTFKAVPGFTVQPGQYVNVSLPGIDDVSPMAVASGAGQDELKLSVKAWGDLTKAMIKLGPGDQVHIDGPHGTAFPLDQAKDRPLLLVAGGTGLTPVRSIAQSADDAQQMRVVYGAKSPEGLLFNDELDTWGAQIDRVVSLDPAGKLAEGRVTDVLASAPAEPGSVAFVCGPDGMMKAVVDQLRGMGLKDEDIFVSLQRFDDDGKVIGPVLPVSDPVVGY